MKSKRKSRKNQSGPLFLISSGVLILAVALFILLGGGEKDKPQNIPPLNDLPNIIPSLPVSIHKAAPEITKTNIFGTQEALSEYRGQVVLVNNWAIWCPPCKAEMPHLQAYYQLHQDEGFTIIGIEAGGIHSQVTDFVEGAGLTFPIWLDPFSEALDLFQNYNLPSSYVLDRSGQMVLTWTGATNVATLEQYVTPLIKE